MIVGFTGTQRGMTPRQLQDFTQLMRSLQLTEFHHGDCVGADQQAHDIVRSLFPHCWIVVHPPLNPVKRAYCAGNAVLIPADYLVRNKHIVDACELLVATPEQARPILRSGTWATVRYASKVGRTVTILYP